MQQDTDKNVVRILLDVLHAHGVKDVVCSPGSRNAPLLIAAEARADLRKHVVIDERSAAFVALGMASVSRQPVALICTSGTALLNYAPAVAEAYYQGIPLIVVSADRPAEWIDQDDSQTIRQPEALGNIVKCSYDLSDREEGDRPGWYETRIANDAMLTALAPKQGPVHINVRLSPPLGTTEELSGSDSPRIIRCIGPSPIPDKQIVRDLATRVQDLNILVVAGFLPPDARLNKAMLRMRRHKNVVVMAETLSNLHLPAEDYAIDSALCCPLTKDEVFYRPDVVISIGGALVSRKLKEYLRQCAAEEGFEHWSVGYNHTTVDCFQSLTLRIECDPGYFFTAFAPELARARRIGAPTYFGTSIYADIWSDHRRAALERMDRIAEGAPWSDLKAFRLILDAVSQRANLFLSNGTAVRYDQILARSIPHAVYCNRGVSGIDGSTSTAVGGAMAYRDDTVLVTGDMSFVYDVSALQTMKMLRSSLKIIVINNGGGGIFRFISSTSSLDCREKYFCTDPDAPIGGLAEAYGIRYLRATDEQELTRHLTGFMRSAGPIILEVVTPREESAALLRKTLNP